jgi:hypothetical protein
MAFLLAYAKEHRQFPEEQKIDIPYPERKFLPHIIAKRFGITNIGVELNMRKPNSGRAQSHILRTFIRLPKPSLPCCLGVIYHEIAHIVNDRKFHNHPNYHGGHLGTFRTALIKVYCEAKQFIGQARAEAQAMVAEERAELDKASQAYQKKIQQKKAIKAMRKTPEYKMQKLRERIKRLESRAKRISTLLSSARRSLAAYNRNLAKKEAGVALTGGIT